MGHLREGLRVQPESLGAAHPSTAGAELELAELLFETARGEEGRALAEDARPTFEALVNGEDPRTQRVRSHLGGASGGKAKWR